MTRFTAIIVQSKGGKMNIQKIKKLIEEFSKLGMPAFSKNKELEMIRTYLIQDHSDYIHWEVPFTEGRLNQDIIDRIYIDETLDKQIADFKPKTEEDKRILEHIKKFKAKMDEISREMLKE